MSPLQQRRLTIVPISVTKRISLTVKDVSRRPRLIGASAVPAGGGSSPSLPGGSGIMPAGTMTGVRGASL